MNSRSLKHAMQTGTVCIGSWLTLGHPAIAEIMANSGFDWIAIDLEHSVITIREAEDLIRVIELCGVTPLVRLTSNNPDLIKRVLDAGAYGIIVPMIKSKTDAMKAVSSVYYPPRGQRGVGLARAQQYGEGFVRYRKWLENEVVVIVQIEHIDAVHHLHEILSVDGVDGFIVGPYDLSASMGYPGEFDHPEVVAAISEIKSVSRSLNKPGGIHVIEPDPIQLQSRIAEGYTFIAYSLDIRMLAVTCRNGLKKGVHQ